MRHPAFRHRSCGWPPTAPAHALALAGVLAVANAHAVGPSRDSPASSTATASPAGAIQAAPAAPEASAAKTAPRTAAPAPIRATLPSARLAGEGALHWLGLRIYDARLWVGPRGLDPEHIGTDAFALEISYARSLSGAAIAERSAAEIARLDLAATEAQRIGWLERMGAIFPDVRAGDRIAGVFDPRAGTRFFLNDRPIGSVADPAFARAFFGIWLDARTAAPQLREALLHAASPARGAGR
ncbi:MAG: chalcone isomerase family protein [Burkholderiaceae bacterium]|nr:chalcone isomerase family protein [Burkholderiaceae bacterium]HMN65033.1 chalcone isomerase family protein [Burkholderiaceae bacterium]